MQVTISTQINQPGDKTSREATHSRAAALRGSGVPRKPLPWSQAPFEQTSPSTNTETRRPRSALNPNRPMSMLTDTAECRDGWKAACAYLRGERISGPSGEKRRERGDPSQSTSNADPCKTLRHTEGRRRAIRHPGPRRTSGAWTLAQQSIGAERRCFPEGLA